MRFMRFTIGLGLAVCAVASVIAFGDMLFWLSWKGWLGLAAYSTVVFTLSHWLNRISARFERPERIVWLIMLIGLMLSIAMALLLDFTQNLSMVSEYALSQKAMEAGKPLVVHDGRFEYWCNYELLISSLGSLIVPNILIAQILNALCAAAVVYPIFNVARKQGVFVGILISVIVATSPTLAAYTAFTTSEFLGVVFLFYAFYIIRDCMDCDVLSRDVVVRGVACGVVLAVSQLFKPLAIIFLATLFIVLLVLNWRSCRWSVIKVRILFFISILAVYTITVSGLRSSIRNLNTSDIEIKSSPSSPWGGMIIGLDLETDGSWSQHYYDLASRLTPSETKRFVIDRAKRDYRQYPKLICKKFVRLYQSDGWVGHWCRRTTSMTSGNPYFAMVDGAFALMHVLFLLGLVGIIIFKHKPRDIGDGIFGLLVVAGFTTVIMLIEIQGRYRTSIYPFYFMVMPYAKVTCDTILASAKKFLSR